MWSFLKPEPHKPLLPKEKNRPHVQEVTFTGLFRYIYRVCGVLFST